MVAIGVAVFIAVSVPLPGFSGLRLEKMVDAGVDACASFSPVAGIQWVETKQIRH